MVQNCAVSCIIPVYNAEKYLEQTLSALEKQTIQNVEFLLIDDGSTDTSGAIIDAWCHKDLRFRGIHIPNGGVYNARLRGIRDAGGEYVAFCDSDDIPLPRMMEKMYQRAMKTKADMVVCGYVREEMDTGRILSREMSSFGNRVISLPEDAWALPIINAANWNKLIRTEVARKAIVFSNPPRVLEDMMFQCSLYPHIKRIAFVSDKLYRYRVRPDGALSQIREEEMSLLKKDMLSVKRLLICNNADRRIMQACDSVAFIHFGLSVVIRQTQAGGSSQVAVRRARRYLTKWFPEYKKTGMSLMWNVKNGMLLIKPLIGRWFFCANMMTPFLAVYNFVTRRLKLEIKW